MKLYDEKVWSRQENADGSLASQTYFRVRLFGVVVEDRENPVTIVRWSVYFRVEDTDVYDPDESWPKHSQRCRTYVTGPDSKRIREAIAVVDNFVAVGTN